MVANVSNGPPTASPNALAVTRAPAAGTDTAGSAAMRSSIPTTSISAQPITNAPVKSTARMTRVRLSVWRVVLSMVFPLP